MAHDALGAHARDELGISEITTARPVQAALASAGTFAVGALLPLAVALLAPPARLIARRGRDLAGVPGAARRDRRAGRRRQRPARRAGG